MVSLLVRSRLLQEHGFAHGFSLRTGGASRPPFDSLNLGRAVGDDPAHVAENHRRMAEAVGYADGRLFEVSQVHGRAVRQVHAHEQAQQVRKDEGDALVTRQSGVCIGVRAADCLPLLIADPQTRAVAAVHAGWRGAAAGVVIAGASELAKLAQAPASRLIAAVFPHIRPCCFEVGDEVAHEIASYSPDPDVILRDQPKPHVDLAAVVRAQLLQLGLRSANMDDVPGCTRCEPQRFFSYRRDGKQSGRHLAAILAA